MTVTRQIYKHRLQGIISLNTRKELQDGNLHSMRFNFPERLLAERQTRLVPVSAHDGFLTAPSIKQFYF